MNLEDQRCPSLLCSLLTWLVCVAGVLAADQSLFDFAHATDLSRFSKSDTSITAVKVTTGMVMRMATGTSQLWPGVTLSAPDGHWDLSPFAHVVVEVKNAGATLATLNCRVDNPGANGTEHCVNGDLSLNANQSGTLLVTLLHGGNDTLGGKLFGMRGYPVSAGGHGIINPSNINQIVLFCETIRKRVASSR